MSSKNTDDIVTGNNSLLSSGDPQIVELVPGEKKDDKLRNKARSPEAAKSDPTYFETKVVFDKDPYAPPPTAEETMTGSTSAELDRGAGIPHSENQMSDKGAKKEHVYHTKREREREHEYK